VNRQPFAVDLPGVTLEVVAQIDSTNSELMRRARAGHVAPVLLVAEQQTAGRGRLGRQWFSAQATSVGPASLTFSLGLPLSPRDWSGLSLAVGVSIARSLHPELQLKWPNDIWWHGRKLAGILIETASMGTSRYLVAGVGINIEQPQTGGLATPPAWLRELLPGIDAQQTLQRVAPALLQAIKVFEQQGFQPFVAGFDERDALNGVNVTLSDGTNGVAQGVDAGGALQVQTEHGLKAISSAEVSVRPLQASPQALP
jgi:BirA family transcriptional regulator, biotin operon repressor / biotin---[acetyl-CoA-carboxylase] ligase